MGGLYSKAPTPARLEVLQSLEDRRAATETAWGTAVWTGDSLTQLEVALQQADVQGGEDAKAALLGGAGSNSPPSCCRRSKPDVGGHLAVL